MKYIPSIAFEEMSGSAKGVTAAKTRGRKYIRKRQAESHPEISEWYTCAEIQERYQIKPASIYDIASTFQIPTKKVHNVTYYSKVHFDMSREIKPTTKRITFDEMPNVIAQLSLDILEKSNALHILMEEVEGLREHIMAKPVSARRIPVSFERACEITGKAKNTMYRYTSQGLIPHYKRGKTVYFFEDELLEQVRNSRIETLLERQWDKGQRDTKQPNQDENTDFKITALFLNYTKMLSVWNSTQFVFLSDDCVDFKVSTPIYKGTVIITWQDNAFYSVCFRDMELKILGISNAEKVLDLVKDYVEMGEVWV